MTKRITIDIEYEIGAEVYLRTDPEQCRGIVRAIEIRTNGAIAYEVIRHNTYSSHFGYELTATPDIMYRTSN